MEKTKMDFDVLTLFPEMFAALTQYGVTGRACEQQLTSVTTWNIRDFSEDSRKTVDDRAYGGGPGMVMMAKPLESCLEAVGRSHVGRGLGSGPVCLLSPQGEPFTQKLATDILNYRQLTLICGRYEAVDQRFIDGKVDLEISIGDFVVSGGELPAMMNGLVIEEFPSRNCFWITRSSEVSIKPELDAVSLARR